MIDRYEELDELFTNNGLHIDADNLAQYVRMFDIISSFTDYSLSTKELFEAFDFLSDLIVGKKPQYAIMVPKEDRISIQMRLMEEMPQTAGKLSSKEKELFAFCVYHATCIQVFDEETKTIVSGLTDFTSEEHIRQLFDETKQSCPELFKVNDRPDMSGDARYGLDPEFPVMLTSISMSSKYLAALRYEGHPISYKRVCSRTNSYDEIIDEYDIIITERHFLRTVNKVIKMYINPYALKPVVKAPLGFTI